MLVAQNSLGPVCPVPLTVRGRADEWQPDYVPVHLHASVADNLAIDDFVKDFRSVLPKRLRRLRRPPAEAVEEGVEVSPPPVEPLSPDPLLRARSSGSEG